MIYLGNAFSLQMLDLSVERNIKISPVEIGEVIDADFISVVGHQDTANVLSSMLGKEVAFNRSSLSLKNDDILYVAQVIGGRLPEGCTILPEGFKLVFVKVSME